MCQTMGKFTRSTLLQFTQLYAGIHVIDSGGYLCMNSVCINCSMAGCFPEKLRWCTIERVCQGVKCSSLGLLLFCSQQQAVEHVVTAACQPPHHSRLSTMTNSTTNILVLLQLSGIID